MALKYYRYSCMITVLYSIFSNIIYSLQGNDFRKKLVLKPVFQITFVISNPSFIISWKHMSKSETYIT